MKYNVKWIIDGEIINNANSKEEAEENIKVKLENLISNNKKEFEDLGATAIQGSASLIDQSNDNSKVKVKKKALGNT